MTQLNRNNQTLHSMQFKNDLNAGSIQSEGPNNNPQTFQKSVQVPSTGVKAPSVQSAGRNLEQQPGQFEDRLNDIEQQMRQHSILISEVTAQQQANPTTRSRRDSKGSDLENEVQ